MNLKQILDDSQLMLAEAAVVEAVRRSGKVRMHPRLQHALHIYDPIGKKVLAELYNSFISIAHRAQLPITVSTPTWRANHERLAEAGVQRNVNADAVSFLNPVLQDQAVLGRLIGYQANASSQDHSELDKAEKLQVDDVDDWCDHMLDLNRRYGVKILGGCCGTNADHLDCIVNTMKQEKISDP